MIFDSHAHYDDKAFDRDRKDVLDSLVAQGIASVVNAGASIHSVKKTLELAERYSYIHAAVGIHPEHADELTDAYMEELEQMLEMEKVVAVGEIGLDYYWDEPARQIQQEGFIRQLHLAKEKQMPVVIHSRDAAADTLRILKEEYGKGYPAYIHCFSYSKEMAEEFLRLGCMIGIGGVVTFKNARKVKEVVEHIPMDRLLLETDCPYLAPVPHRGERNTSLNLFYVAEEIARIKGIGRQEVEEITCRNAQKFFGIAHLKA